MTASQILGTVFSVSLMLGLVWMTILQDGWRVLWGWLFAIAFTALFCGSLWLALGSK